VVHVHAPQPSNITNELPGPVCVAHQHHSSVQLCMRTRIIKKKKKNNKTIVIVIIIVVITVVVIMIILMMMMTTLIITINFTPSGS